MKKEQEIDWRVGKIFVMQKRFKDDGGEIKTEYEFITFKKRDEHLTYFKKLNGEEDFLLNDDIKIRELCYFGDFLHKLRLELKLKPCVENILLELKLDYGYYNLAKWSEVDEVSYVIIILKYRNDIKGKYFKIKKEKFNNIYDLINSDFYQNYSTIDELFEISGNDFDKIKFLNSFRF